MLTATRLAALGFVIALLAQSAGSVHRDGIAGLLHNDAEPSITVLLAAGEELPRATLRGNVRGR